MLLSVSPFVSVSVCLMYEVLVCRVHRYLELLCLPFGLIPWSLHSLFPCLVILFILRSILSEMRIATPAFFCFLFSWNLFFHLLIFSLYVSLGLKWVSCRQHICGSCFCIHSANMCLLVGAFNPFTFKVIIDIYVPIAIFLIIRGWFCGSFSSLVFLDYISQFNICCKAGLVVLNSLNSCLSENLLISPSSVNEILAR